MYYMTETEDKTEDNFRKDPDTFLLKQLFVIDEIVIISINASKSILATFLASSIISTEYHRTSFLKV